MPVKIRLQRWGCRNLPFYRMVVADSRAPRDGKFIEKVGHYNPLANKDGVKEIGVNSDRIKYWLAVGAQPSERVSFILSKINLIPAPPVRMSTKYLYKPRAAAKTA